MRKDRFHPGKYLKLRPRVYGPFRVVERIGENAYKLELPNDYEISPTFKVKDLRPYHEEDMRTSLFSQIWRICARAIPSHEESKGSVDEGKSFEEILEWAINHNMGSKLHAAT